MSPKTQLLAMVMAVPVMVGLSGLASFLLLRMGYGVLVWALLPFLGLLLLVAALGFLLSRVRGSGGSASPKSSEED
jgi:hypothetical protein